MSFSSIPQMQNWQVVYYMDVGGVTEQITVLIIVLFCC